MNIRKSIAMLAALASFATAANAAPTTYNFSMNMTGDGALSSAFTGTFTIDPTKASGEYNTYDKYSSENTLQLTAFSASGTLTDGTTTGSVSYSLSNLGFFGLVLNPDNSFQFIQLGTEGKYSTVTGNVAIGMYGDPAVALYSHMDSDDFGMFGTATFTQAAAPVPEPGEWAMIAGGLGLVGAAARRRRIARAA